ncbi:MAG: hypothetical protein ACLVLH_05455 [Eisenbergiella massiliensis]
MGEHEVYRGTLTDLPLKEEIILKRARNFSMIPIPALSTGALSG